jgi:hypothetical protein
MMHACYVRPASLFPCGSHRRLLSAAALTAVALAAAACGGPTTPVSLPAHPETATAAPAALAGPSLTPRQQVARAYRAYWLAYAAAMTAGRAGRARRILAPYEAATGMTEMIRSLQKVWAAHDAAYGGAVTHVKGVHVTGRRALLHDCLDLSQFGVLNKDTGRVVPGSFGLPSQDFYVSLELSGGHWRVRNMQPVEVPCTT